MYDNSPENYRRVKGKLDSSPRELRDAMEQSIAKFIREHQLTVVNSSEVGRSILSLEDATEWNTAFGRKDASSAFGMLLKQYMYARLALWRDATGESPYEDWPGKTYVRKSL